MKSYTDLEQSKKLAEILPTESADMYWLNRHIDLTETKYEVFVIDKSNKYIDFFKSYAVAIDNNEIIPCWSLAALLNVFPNSEQKSVDICHGGWKGEEYVSDWFCSYDDYEKNYFETTNSDNPVDACVEMIIKLKENKVL